MVLMTVACSLTPMIAIGSMVVQVLLLQKLIQNIVTEIVLWFTLIVLNPRLIQPGTQMQQMLLNMFSTEKSK